MERRTAVRCHVRAVGGCSNAVCSVLPVSVVGFISSLLMVMLVCQAHTVSQPNNPGQVATTDGGGRLEPQTSAPVHVPVLEQQVPLNIPNSSVSNYETQTEDEQNEEDVVVRFLRIVEQYERDKHNCTAGTDVSLGEGVVQQYGVKRFMAQALATVSRANLLTRFWMAIEDRRSSTSADLSESSKGGGRRQQPTAGAADGTELSGHQPHGPSVPAWNNRPMTELSDFLYAQVINLVESDEDIFAAGNCYDKDEFEGHHVFCPYAFRLPVGTSVNTDHVERILAKDLSLEYYYLNSSDWFAPARQKGELISAERNKTMNYRHMRYNDTMHGELRNTSALLVRYDDGHWSKPYFDCGGGFIWMMTYIVPFFGYRNGAFHFKGTSGIDIDLQKVDINQCPLLPGSNETNVFANSSRCPAETTECRPLSGLGFRRGSYICECKRGYYFPLAASETSQRYYNGVLVENEYEKLTKGLPNRYDTFRCLPCSAGCDECEDSSPCVLVLNWLLRAVLLGASAIIMCFVPSLAYFIWRYREVKVIKASSPKLMWLTLVGATFLYCPMLVGYFEPSDGICSARMWLRAVGFSASYGALLLKTWRISVVFRVRSARTLRISDTDLIKRLGILVLVAVIYVSLRTVWGRPHAEPGKHNSGLKTHQCSYDVWDYCQAGGELLLLLWGIRLCIVVRKAPSEFNESRFISWAIYNETLLSLFLSLAMLFLQSPANPDLLYIIQFIHTNLTTTVNLVFLFGSKAYLVYRRKQREAALTKDDVLLKSKGSTSFRYTKSHKTSFNNEGSGNDVSLLYKDIEEELSRVYTELEVLKRKQMEAENPHLALSPKHSLTVATVSVSPQKCNAVGGTNATNNNNNSSNPRFSVNRNGATVPLLINYRADDSSDASPSPITPTGAGSFGVAVAASSGDSGGSTGALPSIAASFSNNLLAEGDSVKSSAVNSGLLMPPPSEPMSSSAMSLPLPQAANLLRTRCTCGSSGKGRTGSSHRYAVTAAAVRKIFLNIDDLKEATPV